MTNSKKPSKYSILKHKWSDKCKIENCEAPVYNCPTCKEKHGLIIKSHLVRHLGTVIILTEMDRKCVHKK